MRAFEDTTLNRGQIEFFNEHGYLVVDEVLDEETILRPLRAEYAALLDHLYDGWWAEGLVGTAPDGLSFEDKLLLAYRARCDWFQPFDISLPGDRVHADTPFHFGPSVFDLVTEPALLDVVETLIGPEITSNPIQHIRIKPPSNHLADDEIHAHVTATDWHQDRGVTLPEADHTTMVTCWCAITDATVQNGCLQVIPDVHREGLKPHCPRTQLTLANGVFDYSAAVPLPVRAGGVVCLHPLTPHSSLVNRSDGIRWSFDLRYNVTGQPTGRAHFPSFVARSRKDPSNVLTSDAAWCALWEEARIRLAATPHIDLYRWDGDAAVCA